MENEMTRLGVLLLISGLANILMALMIVLQDIDWRERYVAQADRFRRSKNQPEAPKPQEVIK